MKTNPLPIIRIMSKCVLHLHILFSFGISSLNATVTNAQSQSVKNVQINLVLEDASLIESFDAIESQTDFSFVYSKEKLAESSITLNTSGTVMDALLEIAKQANLKFKQINSNISVYQNKEKNAPEPLVEIKEVVSISGTVTDETGEALPGATVLEKGTSNGVVTDFNGAFTLEVDNDAVLVVSFMGFLEKEVKVANQTTFNIILSTDIASLLEVVVIGYGQVEKQDVSGAISSIKAKDFNAGVISSPEQLIQGRTTGVQITTGSGEPGAAVNVRVRGTSSIRSGNNPLFVVDGFPLDGSAISPSGANAGSSDDGAGNTTPRNPLIFLDPSDIVSIDILKDASATAIYGSRGANGVIIITTRRGGSDGKTTLNYTGSVSSSTITKKLDLLSADEFRSYVSDELDFGGDTDWQDVIFRNAISQSHNISFGGGSEDSRYNFSIGYNDQNGIVEKSGLTRYNVGVNTDYNLFENKLNIQSSVKYAYMIDDNPQISNDAGFTGDLLSGAWRANPTRPIFNDDGSYAQPDENERNPAAILGLTRDNTYTGKFLGTFSATYNLTDNLSYKLNVGIDNSRSERKSALSSDLNIARVAGLGRADFSEVVANSKLIEHTLNYKADIGNGTLSALAGFSFQNFITETRYFTLTGFASPDLDIMINNMESADFNSESTARVGGSTRNVDELQSFFGRVNYDLADKYIFTATVRSDGSSKFGENNRYGFFPSLAFAWRMSEEDFIPSTFYDLKFRAGWGITGNQEFPGGNNVFRQRYDVTGSLVAPQFGNPDLKWETTTQINFGIDFAFFEGRVYGNIDLYHKNTKDILFRSTSAQPAVQPFVFQNLDIEVQNRGLEFGINALVVESSNLKWNSGFNISFNRNEASNVGLRPIQTGAISGQGLTGAFAQVIKDGEPLFSYSMSEFEGFDEDGFNVFANDGEADLVGKSALPDYVFGFSNSLEYKRFTVNAFFTGQIGAYIYNNNGNALFLRGSLINGGKNVTRDVANNGENPTNGNNVSTRWLENGSFGRLQNLSFAYDVNLADSKNFRGLNISLNIQNLLTITNYSGQDPEVNVDKAIDGVPSLGIDYSAYPRARVFTLGVKASFN